MADSLITQAMAFFQSKGYTKEQAGGIVANLHYESGGLNIKAVGDGGKAYGLAQWHPDRQANFARVFGKSIRDATFEEQLAFVDWELNNTETNARDKLKSATTTSQATQAFMQYYERPANMSSLSDRITRALKATGGTLISQFPAIGVAIGASGLASQGADAVVNTFDKVISWIPRIVAILAGIILITIAIAAVTMKSDIVTNISSAIPKG